MTSNYKKLGPYIRQVDQRNLGGKETDLLGVSTQKVFIKSIANTVGTNWKKYKIVRRRQFTYVADTSRRGDKIGIAMLEDYSEALVSQAYTVFEVIDTNELLPEYLMMWFRRPEFDRYARFKSHGSVREIFDWDELCEVELPIPSPEKQQEIVHEYNTVVYRIKLNEELNQKLEDTAQTLYRHWFVDFEFPISKEYAETIDKPELEGQPYKSSGGEIVYNEELEKEIPVQWTEGILDDLGLDISDGNYSSKYPKSSEFLSEGIPFIRGTDFYLKSISPFNLQYISEKKHSQLLKGHTKPDDILISTRGEIGKYAYISDKFVGVNINSQLVRINGGKKYPTLYLGCLLNSKEYKKELLTSTTGSALQQLSLTNFRKTRLVIPQKEIIREFYCRYNILLNSYLRKTDENIILQKLSDSILCQIASLKIPVHEVY